MIISTVSEADDADLHETAFGVVHHLDNHRTSAVVLKTQTQITRGVNKIIISPYIRFVTCPELLNATYLASVLSFRIRAQDIVGKAFVGEFNFALLVVDNIHGGVPEDIGIAAAGFRVSPAHDGHGQVISIKTIRHQANGSDVLRVFHG